MFLYSLLRSKLNSQLVQIDDPTPPDKLPCRVQTFVRPLDKFPPNFDARARASSRGAISPVTNETMLLNQLIREFNSLVLPMKLTLRPA